MRDTVFSEVLKATQLRKKFLAVLVDPDKVNADKCLRFCEDAKIYRPDIILVGGSVITIGSLDETVETIKSNIDIPVVLFPGSGMHITPKADAILFLSLVSGRNPEYLIGQQVASAPLIKKIGIETIPTGYVLIDGGVTTTVNYISNTQPIPHMNNALAMATALASEMLGQNLIYLDCGSGAKNPVDSAMIEHVKNQLTVPLWIGGGIRTKSQAEAAYGAGADALVIGSAIEDELSVMKDMCEIRDTFNA